MPAVVGIFKHSSANAQDERAKGLQAYIQLVVQAKFPKYLHARVDESVGLKVERIELQGLEIRFIIFVRPIPSIITGGWNQLWAAITC